MKNFVREYLIEQSGGDKIYVTKLSIGYRYRIECNGEVIESGVISFEQHDDIFKLGKQIHKHTEKEEDITELKEELEQLKEEKEELVKEEELEQDKPVVEEMIEEDDEDVILNG